MPIYDFQCQSCQFKSEVMRKSSAANTEACPSCGLETFTKQLSAPSFQLNGSGWYATDFKNSGKKPAANPATAPTSEPSSVTETSSASGCKTGCACH